MSSALRRIATTIHCWCWQNPVGPTCHKGTSSCFGDASHQWLFLYQLEQLLAERKTTDPASSYTAKLYASGTKRIAQKVGEEGVENRAGGHRQ
ncbi:phosphoribosyl-AMP cyclohydrolase / phosphoribosyl-ATP pyrophosphohydrolase [Salmonella enterica subsp. enterica]|uniref:phosphoribosyl-ATP diphosphatase n=1 Tax=Salmonella enterica I TaxID=59201 RepID=A0A447U0M7_SALET|nr:phosphoribosyl-AMP cyclohydrolase / phosphoribosyl-ATP pyrophosphohydrolase [Salmonella enterica subsp. enterica]